MAKPGGRILCYHDISNASDSPYAVTPSDFDRQMRYLVEHCALVSVDELVRAMRTGGPIPPRAIAVTIDDGYLGVYSHAYPIL